MSRHHHHDPAPPACCSCCACACSPPAPAPCGGGGGYFPAPPPQPAPGSDQLLHAIAAHLLLNSAPPPPPQAHPQAQPPPQHQHQPHPQPPPPQHQPHPQPPQPQHQHQPQPQPQPHPQPPPNPAVHHANLYASYAYQHQQQQTYPQPPAAPPAPPPQQHQHQPNPPDHGQLLLHSLLRRVAALETTLPHVLPSPPAPHPQQPNPRRHHRAHAHQEDPRSPSPPPRRARRGPPSERELAARTIQEHFRRFLARRSRTLRQLKELAMLRSKAASLRASLSGSGRRRCKDPMAISEAALGMLYRLDGIQGGDPMIREGKHALSRELGRILEFVDKVLLKEQQEMGEDGAFDDYPEGCHGMNRPTVNMKVSFRGNEANTEADESSESSSSTEADETKAANSKKSVNGKPGLAAPVPVHMESRRTGGEM